MDRRNLYKVNNSYMLNSNAKAKRVSKINEERSTKRKNLFLTGRDLEDITIKENEEPSNRRALKEFKMASKREAYVSKYLAWKAEKEKKREEEKKNKAKPFVSAVKSSLAAPAFKFEPPVGHKCHSIGKKHNHNENKKLEEKQVTKNRKQVDIKPFRKPLAPVKSGNAPATKSKLEKGAKQTLNRVEKIQNKNLLQPLQIKPMTLYTPNKEELLCPAQGDDFTNFLTSTGRKFSHNPNALEEEFFEETISPIDVNQTEKIFHEEESKTQAKNGKRKSRSARKSLLVSQKSDDNANNTTTMLVKDLSPAINNISVIQCEQISSTSPNVINNIEMGEDLNTTPDNQNIEQLSNYMSPFVTISRGKVSAKKEREKRESIYILEKSSPCDTIEVRRARESIKYFRKILNDEISRLHSRCDFWEQYKMENTQQLEEVGSDMINATIGQTKLLTSKKIEQFRGLIDRCEEGIGRKSKVNEESTQKILPEDLEGFWSMVQLQIENVDKRFENLEQWKANNWNDPDEEKPKPKKNLLTKVTKTKKQKSKSTKPNERLKELLKKAQDAYKKSKNEKSSQNDDIIFVASKKRSSSGNRRSASNTPVRRSFKRRDSSIAGSNTKSSSSKRRKSTGTVSTRGINSTPRRADVKVRRSLLVNTLNKAHEKKSLVGSPLSVRKSILKTPGTTKKHKQRVIFNEKLDFNSPKNQMSGIEAFSDNEDTDLQRSMHLRSRKVIMRPNLEIEIP